MKKIKYLLLSLNIFLMVFFCVVLTGYASGENQSFSDGELQEICNNLKEEMGSKDYIGELIKDFRNIKNNSNDYIEKIKCDAIISYLEFMYDWDDDPLNSGQGLQKLIVKLGCAYFKMKNCKMAAELLLESYRLAKGDDTLGEEETYVVLNNHIMVHTSQYETILNSSLYEGNVFFADSAKNICERDCYYALRRAKYEMVKSEPRIADITDRYDFDWTNNPTSMIEVLCNVFYYLTEIGVIKKYNLVVKGEIPHYMDELRYNSNEHFSYCSACGFESNQISHTYKYSQFNYDYHNKYCAFCGYATKEGHNWVKYNIHSGEYEIQYIPGYRCRKCGMIKEGEIC